MFDAALELVYQAVAAGELPSAAVAVGKGSKSYVRKVFGYTATGPDGIRADENTLYDMASLTKLMVTAMITLRLVEQGRICLSDTLDRYPVAMPPDKSTINLFQLMTHTSGLPAHFSLDPAMKEPHQAADIILGTPLTAASGTKVIYSCMGYILLAQILERLMGRPLDQMAEDMVFTPLGMNRTGYRPEGDNIAATEWDPVWGDCLKGVVHDENARALDGVAGNAGVFSTIGDAAAFAGMLSKGGSTEKGWFLSAQTFKTAITNHTPGLLESRGLGFKLIDSCLDDLGDLFSQGSYGHTGFTGTSIWVDANTGVYMVLLTNRVHPTRENQQIFHIRRSFHNAVIAEASRCHPVPNDRVFTSPG